MLSKSIIVSAVTLADELASRGLGVRGATRLFIVDQAGAGRVERHMETLGGPGELISVGPLVAGENDGHSGTLASALASFSIGSSLVLAVESAWALLVDRAAQAAGWDSSMVTVLLPEDAARNVYCAPCSSVFRNSPSGDPEGLLCPGCGLPLDVSTHYSRRLGAYLGVGRPLVESGAGPKRSGIGVGAG